MAQNDITTCSNCGRTYLAGDASQCECDPGRAATFAHYGATNDLDHDPRRETPREDQFGDARELRDADAGEQHQLVTDASDDQRTLAGERAAGQPLFGDSDG